MAVDDVDAAQSATPGYAGTPARYQIADVRFQISEKTA